MIVRSLELDDGRIVAVFDVQTIEPDVGISSRWADDIDIMQWCRGIFLSQFDVLSA